MLKPEQQEEYNAISNEIRNKLVSTILKYEEETPKVVDQLIKVIAGINAICIKSIEHTISEDRLHEKDRVLDKMLLSVYLNSLDYIDSVKQDLKPESDKLN